MAYKVMRLKEKSKYSRFTWIIWVLLFWFVLAAGKSARYHEMVTIAGALSDTPLLGECKINTTIRKDWFLTWSAMGFDLEVVKNDLSLVTSASVYKDFDRKILPSHHKRYHFTWSQFRDGHSVASYLDVELDLNNNLERLTLANCGLFPEKTYHIGYLEACAVEKQVIECS